jgi:hypothetical protein
MPTKQIKQKFQIASDDDVSTQVTVTANGSVVFSGKLNQTQSMIDFASVSVDTSPSSEITFDLDIPLLSDAEQDNVSIPIEITCTDGDIALQSSWSNYSCYSQRDPDDATKYIPVIGTSAEYRACPINSIPLLNGSQNPRYGTDDNPETYLLIVKNGETVTFSISVNRYNDS